MCEKAASADPKNPAKYYEWARAHIKIYKTLLQQPGRDAGDIHKAYTELQKAEQKLEAFCSTLEVQSNNGIEEILLVCFFFKNNLFSKIIFNVCQDVDETFWKSNQ